MTVKELVTSSRSFRGYDPSRRLTEEELKNLVDCARLAPSTGNVQALKFYLAWEPEEVAAIQATTAWARALPQMTLPHPGKEPTAFIVICQDLDIDSNPTKFLRDVGIAAQTMLLAAAEQGLGGCMIAAFQAQKLRTATALPEHLMPQLVVALGKPAEDIRLTEIAPNQSTNYYRDENDVHYVPKRRLEDIIVEKKL